MRIIIFSFTLLLASFLLLSACGSGTPEPTTKHAVLKLSTQGTLATGTMIGTIENITITLPAGVTVPIDAAGNVLDGVVSPSGHIDPTSTFKPGAVYRPASTGSPATLTIRMIFLSGITTGEFATVTCNITGNVPTVTDFNIDQTTFKALGIIPPDTIGKPISGLSASFTLSII